MELVTMNFWAIAYKYQEDVYYNVATDECGMTMSEQCLLPSEELAKYLIEESLNDEYVPVEIKIESLSKQGVLVWGRGEIKEWDENY